MTEHEIKDPAGAPASRPPRRGFMTFMSDMLARLWGAFPHIHAFLLTIAGVDAGKLAKCPRDEQVTYPTLGLLMVIAATFTGLGISLKLGAGMALGPFHTALLFGLFFSFALSLETVVLGTLKTSAGWLGGMTLRVFLGLALLMLQVLPLLVWIFQPMIDFHQHKLVAVATAEAKSMAEKTYDLAGMELKARTLAAAEVAAREAVLNPQPSPKLRDATERLEKSNLALTVAIKAVDHARQRLADAQSRLLLEPLKGPAQARAAIEKAVQYWSARLATRLNALSEAEAEKSSADADRTVVAKAWYEELEAHSKAATQAHKNHDEAIAHATKTVNAETTTATNLAKKATASRFFNDAAALLTIMLLYPSVLMVSIFILLIALLVDLMPLYTKWNLAKNGVYAQMVADESAVTRALSSAHSAESICRIRIQHMQAEDELASAQVFSEQDGGATRAAILAMKAEIERDSLSMTAQAQVAQAGLEAIRCALEKARAVHALVKEDPTLSPMFRLQLEALIAKLQAAANLADTPAPQAGRA